MDEEIVSRHLAAGERIEWTGRPDPRFRLQRADAYLIPFSILWGGFAIVWETLVIAGGAPFFFSFWGIPFVALGLYMMVGRFFYRSYRAKRTYYAVTDQRVLTVSSGRRGESVDSMYVSALPRIATNVGSHGSGDVIFGQPSWITSWYANTGLEFFARASGGVPFGFYGIDDPQTVAATVESVRRSTVAAIRGQ